MPEEKPHQEEKANVNLLAVLPAGALMGALTGLMVSLRRRPRGIPPRKNSTLPESQLEMKPQASQPKSAPHAPAQSTVAQAGGGVKQQTNFPENTRWSKPTKYLVGIGLFITFVLILYISRSVLPLVIIAALIAFIVRPIILGLMRRLKMKKGGAVMLTYFLVIIFIVLMPLVLIPAMLDSFNFLIGIDYKTLATNLVNWVNQMADGVQSQPILDMLFGTLLRTAADTLNSLLSGQPAAAPLNLNLTFDTVSKSLAQTLGTLTSVVGPLISASISVIFTLLISLQLAMSWDDAAEAFPKIFPPAYKKELGELADGINRTWNAFLRGQLTLMVVVGVVTWIGAIILGAPQPFLLALVAGILEIIPSVGPFLAGAVGVTLSLLFGSSFLPVNNLIFAAIILAFYFLVQMLENQVLVPYIMGDAVDLPPVVVLIGVVVFGSAFGLLGVFLATPIIATGRLIFTYLHTKILEPAPTPTEPEPEKTMWDRLEDFSAHIRKLFAKPGPPEKNNETNE